MNKLLILLIFFMGTALADPEPIRIKHGEITNVLVTMYYYDTYEELQQAFPDWGGVEGISICERNVERNIAWCEIHQMKPTVVDGDHSLTLGHEVAHGLFGSEYHE